MFNFQFFGTVFHTFGDFSFYLVMLYRLRISELTSSKKFEQKIQRCDFKVSSTKKFEIKQKVLYNIMRNETLQETRFEYT